MTVKTATRLWRPDFRTGEEEAFPILETYRDVPAVAYISRPAGRYYRLTELRDTPVPEIPSARRITLEIELLGWRQEEEGPDRPGGGILRGLRYTSNEGATGVMALLGSRTGSPFLAGRVYFFGYVYNPDKGEDGVTVHRTLALGLKRPESRLDPWGAFGFVREISSHGDGFPAVAGDAGDFEIWSSPASRGEGEGPFRDLTFEAGSPAALG